MEQDEIENKLTILPGHAEDFSACTFVLLEEDHTLGNALRYIIMRNPKVEFCGYSAPHPSEDKIHLRIQMYDGLSAKDALIQGCEDLEAMTEAIEKKYEEALARNDYEVVESDDPVIDWEAVREKAEQNRQKRNEQEKRTEAELNGR